mgnify:CR=1 FL=1
METIVAISILLAALAGIVTSVTLLWVKVVRPFFRFCKRIGAVVDTVQDLPEWCAQTDNVLKELRPNHGGSIKDKINAMSVLLQHHMDDKESHNHRRHDG